MASPSSKPPPPPPPQPSGQDTSGIYWKVRISLDCVSPPPNPGPP
jgi:hypothetical protein